MLNKKMLLSILIIGCIATMASAGIFAYFDSSASTADDSSVKAGSLKLNVDDIAALKFTTSNIKPGDNGFVGSDGKIDITNIGNIKGDLSVALSTSTQNDIKNHMTITLVQNSETDSETYTLYEKGSNLNSVPLGTLDGGEIRTYYLKYSYENVNGEQNSEQDQSFPFTLNFYLKQSV